MIGRRDIIPVSSSPIGALGIAIPAVPAQTQNSAFHKLINAAARKLTF
jgi:hypothetical protein